MSMFDAAFRLWVDETKAKVVAGEKPRDVFERIAFVEAREQLEREKKRG